MSKSPHGIASLKNGQIEIMLDRYLTQSHTKMGPNESVTESILNHHEFQLIYERRLNSKWCKPPIKDHPAGFVTVAAHLASLSLQYPLIRLVESSDRKAYRPPELLSHFEFHQELNYGVDIFLVSIRPHVRVPGFGDDTMGTIVHRTLLDTCFKYEPEYDFVHMQQDHPVCLSLISTLHSRPLKTAVRCLYLIPR